MAERTESVQDYHYHHATYMRFMRGALIMTLWVVAIVLGLAIGGTSNRWVLGGLGIVVATIANVMGITIRSLYWRPGAVMVALLLALLLLVNYG